jgi:D-3-phosphoglycerate dehydrogenase
MKGWGVKLLANDPFVEQSRADALEVKLVDLETLCREADYISMHVPLLPETRHLISQKEFSWMRPGVILINTARGPVVDTKALLVALHEGRVARAGLDVFEDEPPPTDSPLRANAHVVLSDHVAWYSEESQIELKLTAAQEAVRVCTGGLPLSLANPGVLRRMGRLEEWSPNDTVKWQLKRLEKLSQQPNCP